MILQRPDRIILGVILPLSSCLQHHALSWELSIPTAVGLSSSVFHILLLINETAHLFINRASCEMLAWGPFFFFFFCLFLPCLDLSEDLLPFSSRNHQFRC